MVVGKVEKREQCKNTEIHEVERVSLYITVTAVCQEAQDRQLTCFIHPTKIKILLASD